MKKFTYNIDIYEHLTRWKKQIIIAPFGFAFGGFCLIKGLTSLEMIEQTGSWLIILGAFIGIVIDVITYMRISRIADNLSKCYLTIDESYISGYSFNKIDEGGDGRYCEIKFDQIRNIRVSDISMVLILGLYNSNNFYNLIIETPEETYRFCLSSCLTIKKEVYKAIDMQRFKSGDAYIGDGKYTVQRYHGRAGVCDACQNESNEVLYVSISEKGSTRHMDMCAECVAKYSVSESNSQTNSLHYIKALESRSPVLQDFCFSLSKKLFWAKFRAK